jgi:hypothetical protein
MTNTDSDPNAPIFDLAGLLDSPEVRAEVQSRALDFIHQMFDTAEDALDEGGPMAQALIRSMLPALVKQTAEETADKTSTAHEILAEVREMFGTEARELAEHAGLTVDDPDDPDDPDDD